jgi:flagellar hook assembly protein FlgD
MSRKLAITALCGLIFAPATAARPTQVMPGVTYERTLQWTGAGPVATYVVTAPRPVGLYSLTALLSNGRITGRETVSSMQRNASARMTSIGVNGDFSHWVGGWPTGLMMRGGVVEHQPVPGRAAVGVDTAGNLHVDRVPWYGSWRGPSTVSYRIAQLNGPPRPNSTTLFTPAWGPTTPAVPGTAVVLQPFPATLPRRDLSGPVVAVATNESVAIPADGAVLVGRGTAAQYLRDEALPDSSFTLRIPLQEDWASVTDAVGGGPTLIRAGRPIFNAGEALTKAQLTGRNPRTAIGQRDDGGIVMIAVDGRRRGWSVGTTNWDLALTLMRYGCVTAVGLDGGGSTTVAFEGNVLNRPSDRSGERPVGNALVVAYTGVYAPTVAPTLSPNGDGAGDVQTLSYKLVRPAQVSAKLVAPDGTTRELDAGQRAAGRYRFSWKGTDEAGAPALEGRYQWNVSAADDAGQASTHSRTFTVDNTLGFARVSPGARQIAFTLTRDANIRVTIEKPSGDILRTVAAGPRAAGNVVATWNGRDGRRKRVARGSYVVRIAATSPLGLSALRLPLRIPR